MLIFFSVWPSLPTSCDSHSYVVILTTEIKQLLKSLQGQSKLPGDGIWRYFQNHSFVWQTILEVDTLCPGISQWQGWTYPCPPGTSMLMGRGSHQVHEKEDNCREQKVWSIGGRANEALVDSIIWLNKGQSQDSVPCFFCSRICIPEPELYRLSWTPSAAEPIASAQHFIPS